MKISEKDLAYEEKKLEEVVAVVRKKISSLGQELSGREEQALEFKKFIWDTHAELDPGELKIMMSDNDLEIALMMQRGDYLQKLYKIQNKPYFGNIVFESEDGKDDIYIGITHVEDNLNYLVHDWRSPICSMFYDYELGEAHYEAPEGIITGNILRKRQYIIEDAKLKQVFDNEINIDDELLQEVLATESDDKMKNIVNTIQQEQNKVIRDIEHDNLIVQGIAGSGKTSVALHRIAFLLYKLKYLNSSNVLIFSPNSIFSEYISNVLPELGENNTMQTTMHDFLIAYLKEFREVESFSEFIERYYKYQDSNNYNLIKYKQSDEIMDDIDNYIKEVEVNVRFYQDMVNRDYVYEKSTLNEMLKRYKHFPLFQRIEVIAEKICYREYEGKLNKKRSIVKELYNHLNIDKDYKKIYKDFYRSKYCKIKELGEGEIKGFVNKKKIFYEDASLFLYLKGQLEGFDYNTSIREVVIDEAQDYTKLQYYLINKLFRNAKYTILGDINQTVNPYYKYSSLESLKDIFKDYKYVELIKTYRSSSEIIEYTNRILNLNHVSAIRRDNKRPVIARKVQNNLKELLTQDISFLEKDNKSIAIICKNDYEVEKIYDLLKEEMEIIKIDTGSEKFKRSLVVIPAYIAKGLEFDGVIVYTDIDNSYRENEKNLLYVACTRSQHQLIVYNQ